MYASASTSGPAHQRWRSIHLCEAAGQAPLRHHGHRVRRRGLQERCGAPARAQVGKIELALVGGVYAASSPYRRIVQGRFGTARARIWSVMARKKVRLSELKGKTLLLPDLGPLTTRFVENGLLGGEITLSKWFKIIRAPDVSAAVAGIRLGKADAVLAPVGTAGLHPVIGGLTVAPPAVVVATGRAPLWSPRPEKLSCPTAPRSARSMAGRMRAAGRTRPWSSPARGGPGAW